MGQQLTTEKVTPTTPGFSPVAKGLNRETDQKMCKHRIDKRTPEVSDGTNQRNLDIGLVNIATNESNKNAIPIWEIIDIIALLILMLLVLRWIKKWRQKRKMAKRQKRESRMVQMINPERPRAPLPAIAMGQMAQRGEQAEIVELPDNQPRSSFDQFR